MFSLNLFSQSKDSLDIYVLGNLFLKLFYSFGLTFVICEVGHQLSNIFDNLVNAFNQCEYESLSIDVQQMIPILLLAMQNTPALQSLGSFTCSRETFKNVNTFYRLKK